MPRRTPPAIRIPPGYAPPQSQPACCRETPWKGAWKCAALNLRFEDSDLSRARSDARLQLPAREGFTRQRQVAARHATFAQFFDQITKHVPGLLKFGQRQQRGVRHFQNRSL